MAVVRSQRATQKDGGFGWVVVFAFFTSSIIIDALRYAFGLLYIEFLSEFQRGKGETAWVGSVMICVYNILGPVIAVGINKFGVRPASAAGAVIASLGLVLSSFANQIYVLYFTYGVIQGFGLGVMYLGGWVAVGRYFEKKRGLAIGIAQCGCGVGAFVISPVLSVLIDAYAWRGALLILAGVCLNGCVLSMLYRPIVEDFEDIIDVDHAIGNGTIEKKPNDIGKEHGKLLVQANGSVLTKNIASNSHSLNISNQSSTKIDRIKNFLCVQETVDDPEPRTFAEMREEQLANYKQKVNSALLGSVVWSSSRSVNSLSFRPVIMGSDASLERVLARRRRKAFLDVSLSNVGVQSPNITKGNETETETYKEFPCVVFEKLFPRRLVTDAKLVLLLLSAVFYSMATFVPISLIADYGRWVGCADSQVGWFVSAMGIGGTVGRVICGFVVDIERVNNVWFLSGCLLVCSVANFLCPLLTSFSSLILFSLVYGVCIGSIYIVPPVILVELFGEELIAETMGILMYVCGIVALVGTPIGGWLFDVTGSYVFSFLFCGTLFLLGTVSNHCICCFSTSTETPQTGDSVSIALDKTHKYNKELIIRVEPRDLSSQQSLAGTSQCGPLAAENGHIVIERIGAS